ncbi:MAG: Flp pilus assembly complex ATPase component TadA, partial [Candidatus Hydrogenedentes bacterium]|nr:Flp pilus assembly complex ATPase component TadA [Candidatus Hydrogenedentota bacterium]
MSLLKQLLERATEKGASDIHIKTDSTPYFRIDGELVPRKRVLTKENIEELLGELLNETQRQVFEKQHEYDLAHSDPDFGRFRVNVFYQRGTVSLVMRHIKSHIPDFEDLHLPMAAERFSLMVRGLVLITGTTGSGKSTSLAAIIDYINERRKCHIVTIEDPIEYTHMDKKAVVNQREIKIDTDSFPQALKSVMRQDPDV